MSTIRISADLINGSAAANIVRDATEVFVKMIEHRMACMSAPIRIDPSVLAPEVLGWFDNHPTHYTLTLRFIEPGVDDFSGYTGDYEIDIADPDVALLFKLTWGGA